MFSDYEKLNDLQNLLNFENYEEHLNAISAEMEKLKILMNECQDEEDSLKQQLAETKEETKMLLAKEEELKQLLQNLNSNDDDDDNAGGSDDANSNQMEELLADIYQFYIKEISSTIEGETMNFVYRENQTCSFRILKTLNSYDLLEVSPSHSNMEEIRKDLLDNQDIRGLFVLLRKHFVSLTEPNKVGTVSNIKLNAQNSSSDMENVENDEETQPI